MAFPTTDVLSDFTVSDGDLPTRIPSFTGKIDSDHAGNLFAFGNQCYSGGGGDESAYWNVETFGPDCEVFYTVKAVAASALSMVLHARLQNVGTASPDGYALATVSGSNGAVAYRIDDGVATQLGASMAASWADGDQAGISVVGDVITAYENGTLIDTRTDATYTAAGHIGIEINGGTPSLDDFGGGTIGGGGPAPVVIMTRTTYT